MNNLLQTIQYFLLITAELTLLFLGISSIVAFILLYLPQEKLRQWLTRRGIWGNFLGAFVGSLTPFCACSTIPMTLGMLKAGAPFGSVMSFVIASPLLNPIIIVMILALMGPKAASIYFVVTFAAAIFFGLILERAGGARYVKLSQDKPCCCASSEATPERRAVNFVQNAKIAFRSAWADFKGVLTYLLIGVAIGAIIYGYIPQEFIVQMAGPANPLAVPVAALIGIPLYIRAETAIPIGLALVSKGMSMGAVIALIIGGAGMAIPEMTMLASIFRKRLVVIMAVVICLTAVIGGFVFNALI